MFFPFFSEEHISRELVDSLVVLDPEARTAATTIASPVKATAGLDLFRVYIPTFNFPSIKCTPSVGCPLLCSVSVTNHMACASYGGGGRTAAATVASARVRRPCVSESPGDDGLAGAPGYGRHARRAAVSAVRRPRPASRAPTGVDLKPDEVFRIVDFIARKKSDSHDAHAFNLRRHYSLFVPFNRVGEIVADARLIPSESYVSTQIWSFFGHLCDKRRDSCACTMQHGSRDVLEFD